MPLQILKCSFHCQYQLLLLLSNLNCRHAKVLGTHIDKIKAQKLLIEMFLLLSLGSDHFYSVLNQEIHLRPRCHFTSFNEIDYYFTLYINPFLISIHLSLPIIRPWQNAISNGWTLVFDYLFSRIEHTHDSDSLYKL